MKITPFVRKMCKNDRDGKYSVVKWPFKIIQGKANGGRKYGTIMLALLVTKASEDIDTESTEKWPFSTSHVFYDASPGNLRISA